MKAGDTIELRPGMTKTVLETGSGERAKEGNIVQIDYKGSLDNGTVFDSSHGKKPLKFRIGARAPRHTLGVHNIFFHARMS